MKNQAHEIVRTFRLLAGLHCQYEDLLAYRDRELGHFRTWCVETHLRRCPGCQRETELIEEDLRSFARMDHLSFTCDFLNVPTGLVKLRRAMENWTLQNPQDDKVRELVQAFSEAGLRQLETEIDLYLGNRAAAVLFPRMGRGKEKGRNVVVEAESVLGEFLGPAAASSITQSVLQFEMVMDRNVQGSLPA